MTRRALFRESTTGALDDGAGGTVHGVPDPSGEPDGQVLETSSGALIYATPTSGDVAGDTHAATSKATPVDADEIPLVDSAASFGLKKLIWANLKATLKTYFDTLYAPIGGGGGGASIGESSLVYRYTVSGSDKASIDTGVDTPDAGSNDWANGDVLEVWIYARTDETVALSVCTITLNNDSSAIYDRVTLTDTNTTVAGANGLATAGWPIAFAGASAASGVFGVNHFFFPNFAGTVGNKFAEVAGGVPDTTAANTRDLSAALGYRSATAITRLAIAPATAGKKLKVGSQLLIYKRLAS